MRAHFIEITRMNIHTAANHTADEIIDYAAECLIKQGRKSVKESEPYTCLYRGPNETKCGFGFFIPDSEFSENMESKAASVVITEFFPSVEANGDLFDVIQQIHDRTKVEDWSRIFEMLKEYNKATEKPWTAWNIVKKNFEID